MPKRQLDDDVADRIVRRKQAVNSLDECMDDAELNTGVYELDALDDTLRERALIARSIKDQSCVVFPNDTTNSIIVMNKLYGRSVAMNVAENQPDDDIPVPVADSTRREKYHLFSAFHPYTADKQYKFQTSDFGWTTTAGMPDGDIVRPVALCNRTMQLMEAGENFAWRALVYRQKHAGDPTPTGVVALEGHACDMSARPVLDKDGNAVLDKDGKTVCMPAYSVTTDMADIVQRARVIMETAARLIHELPEPEPMQ